MDHSVCNIGESDGTTTPPEMKRRSISESSFSDVIKIIEFGTATLPEMKRCSIGESSFSDIIKITEYRTATLPEMKRYSIGESSFSDVNEITEIETATLSEMKIISEKLDKEVDEDLISAFNELSKNEDKSEEEDESEDYSESEDDYYENNLNADSSFTSENDLSLKLSVANPTLHQGSDIDFESGLTKEDSCNETEESDKKKLASNLIDSQNEKNEMLEEIFEMLVPLKSQVLSITQMKDEIKSKVESSEHAIQLLQKQLLDRADHLFQVYGLPNSTSEDMKSSHDKDILSYKENIDQLQLLLNSKIKEAEDLALENSELQRKYQQLQMEKVKWVKEISDEFLAQKKCQLFLESGIIEENQCLKLQIHQLEEENSRIKRENSLLKESFLKQWARSLFHRQLHYLHRVNNIIGLPFLK